jgi:glycosyltransferase involved in cell wall biosynthesis
MEMVQHLPDDIEATVITPCGTQSPTKSTCPRGYQVRCFRYAPHRWQILTHGPGGLPATLREKPLARLLLFAFVPALFLACMRAARKADVIHANWSVTGVIAGLAGALTATPCVTTLRGTDIALSERSRVFRAVLIVCAHLNQRLVAVGEGLRERIAGDLSRPTSSITFIPNGVSMPFFQIASPVAQPCLRLVTVGSLVPVKGIDTLLEALALLDQAINWQLTLIGDGPERERLESDARKRRIDSRICFVGAIPPAAIPQALAEHEIFILSSRSEGRPNALIEALAAARVVVASDIPAVSELVVDGENGFLFPVDDAVALATQLRRLHENPTIVARLGEAGRASVTGLSWEETGRRYAALYRALMGGS